MPHLYQRRSFVFLAALGLCCLVGGSQLVYSARLKRRQAQLRRQVEEAVAQVKVLGGLLPICAACKKVREDGGYWSQIEHYISAHSETEFSHGLCPDCEATSLATLEEDAAILGIDEGAGRSA